MGRPGRPAKLRDARFVGILMEEEVLRRIDEKGIERSDFIRGAVEMALSADSLTEVLREKERLREEVKALRRECELKDRRIRELERELERSRGIIAEMGGKLVRHSEKVKKLREAASAKKYRTSVGYLTLEEIKRLYEERKDKLATSQHSRGNLLSWLSAVLYDNPIAIREVAEALGLQDSSPQLTSSFTATADVPTTAPAASENANGASAAEEAEGVEEVEKAAERERTEKMLKARGARRHRRMIEELDFKALAKEWGCSEEEARRIVAERFASSSPPSSPPSPPSSETEGMNSSELIRRARSILEGY